MKVSKSSGGGAWLDKKVLRNDDVVKLVSEAQEVEGQNGPQLVAKVRVKGSDDEAKNVSINAPTKNALIEAFGDDTKNWVNQLLTVNVEKTLIAGKRGIALYLIPEGYSVGEDAGGYLVITKGTVAENPQKEDIENFDNQDVGVDEIPF